MNYAKQFKTRKPQTPQTEPIPGTNQVPNSEGGYVWQVGPWAQFERFLVLGAEKGTFYIREEDLVKQVHTATVACIKQDGLRAVKLIEDISVSGRAYKNDPAIFALALVTVHGDQAAKTAAYEAMPRVCRIGTHLFHFASYASAMRGWGRGLRRSIANWYTSKDPAHLAYQLIKYQQRDGWTHSDLLRLAHPKPTSEAMTGLFFYVIKHWEAMQDAPHNREVSRKGNKGAQKATRTYPVGGRSCLPALIAAFEEAKTADANRLVHLIVEHDLPREAVPTDKLNSVKVWEALLHKMPLTAMIRNLGKMSHVGLIKPLSDASKKVVAALENTSAMKKARIHPLGILVAMKQYRLGHGLKGSLTWAPAMPVLDALDQAFYASFQHVSPIGKPVLIGCDVSGSMTCSNIAGSTLTCAEAVAALALVTANVEKDYLIMAFDRGIQKLDIGPKQRLDTVLREVSDINGGGTDCALPMLYAASNNIRVGGFIVLTDCETYAGSVHPQQALRDYRSEYVEDARQIIVGMTSNDFSIADPNDPLALDVVGFDAAVPALMSDFIRGQPAPSVAAEEDAAN